MVLVPPALEVEQPIPGPRTVMDPASIPYMLECPLANR